MMDSILFPSLERELIAALNTLLAKVGNELSSNVLVSIKHNQARGGKQITLRSDGGGTTNRVLKSEAFAVNVWGATHGETAELATLVEALLPMAAAVNSAVKKVDINLSPTRVNPEGESHQFYLSGIAVIRGTTFIL